VEAFASSVPKLIAQRFCDHSYAPQVPREEFIASAVLFTDISGFTALTERVAPKGSVGAAELTRNLNHYIGRLIDIIAAHGGDILMLAGDALVSIWPVGPCSPTGKLEAEFEKTSAGLTRRRSTGAELSFPHDLSLPAERYASRGDPAKTIGVVGASLLSKID
jgi:class 3 adenylate cyclase